MSRSWIGVTLATVALTAAMNVPAVATDEERGWWPRWGWGMERMMGSEWTPGMMGWWRSDGMLDRVDGRLAYMKTELKITPEQTAAWDTFATVVKASAEVHNDMMRSMAEQFDDGKIFDKALPERLSWQISQMETRLEQMKSVQSVAADLYAALTDEQRAVADDIVLPMMGMGMGRSQGHQMMRW
ncbi:Spy/CpxP family protein refolding chaperone [Chelativorans xinjiangense]|uniref:Spy/CpxP family protein refolding chaperone n=1 Tax=Chelativorans xinjiangense TaxID=2681485 RepID=UPI00135B2DEE|nr:Spy/CpxP family protein refolding chaperone [Chelativorans xinjiangense]